MTDTLAIAPRFVIFSSYGNDSVALIQWAHEQNLEDVAVVFTDTGWAADGWMGRVEKAEEWAKSLGFVCHRTSSIGFRQLARKKKGFPTQRYQWCSYVLKIEPGLRWLEENDPNTRAVCLIGVRRQESQARESAPEWLPRSENHGGRVMLSPFADWVEEDRNVLIKHAGFEVLPHRSRECRCINANKSDMRGFSENDWKAVEKIEEEIGRPMYRPHRHLGAKGAKEMRKWANSSRGKYVAPNPSDAEAPDDFPDEDLFGCKPGWCE
ncbi:phosphoadenosine phosphosulfate reductase family protein [Ahrensia sp. R2A130]|uniref:phosphoadenosine phosphosulfate reductase domain-containing protein n=1 Tax=Ahrensia sp. R2A130 TaxID=744979 RepID=UPI0001E0BCCE|nr:phosphoadenosine phosphosulfate reductase family protein [Ahrensia sp. R2A130]EFL88342.1 putative phosphoadenosine phosphosulfate reductase family [Ahrensia sp. R2A130]